MPQHDHTPNRICPNCSGFASVAIATGVRLRNGSRATIPVNCHTCHGTGTVTRPLAIAKAA
ncbi:hypothetical protein [Streptomyces sp. NRRL WC-3742]|uniref:hypothetical protein n=1 Tax=Streptomyces sp. NRRL WC-3742 TaxID=1463934 RepID=UPI0004CAB1E8|nr:hypothetical protein [Streptomyces sp. NRRL WC-3742]